MSLCKAVKLAIFRLATLSEKGGSMERLEVDNYQIEMNCFFVLKPSLQQRNLPPTTRVSWLLPCRTNLVHLHSTIPGWECVVSMVDGCTLHLFIWYQIFFCDS